MDSWTIAKEVDPIGQNSKGDPVRAIHNGTGWIKLSGDKDLLYKLSPGTKVRHGPVKVYGKSSFATLYEIEKPQQIPQAPAPKPAIPPSAPRPEPQIMGGLPQAQGVPTLDEYLRAARRAWKVAREEEPDIKRDDLGDIYVSAAESRAAFVNTTMIAFTNGKVQAPKVTEPEIPGADAPMPSDDEIHWGRAFYF